MSSLNTSRKWTPKYTNEADLILVVTIYNHSLAIVTGIQLTTRVIRDVSIYTRTIITARWTAA